MAKLKDPNQYDHLGRAIWDSVDQGFIVLAIFFVLLAGREIYHGLQYIF
jgi:hypothetical protein